MCLEKLQVFYGNWNFNNMVIKMLLPPKIPPDFYNHFTPSQTGKKEKIIHSFINCIYLMSQIHMCIINITLIYQL